MSEDRGFGFGCDWIWWLIIIIIILCLCNPGFLGGFGCGPKC